MSFRKRRKVVRKILFLLVFVVSSFSLLSQPVAYYGNAEGLEGAELQQALHDIIDNHSVQSYASLWTAFSSTDLKSDGSIWDMYSDIPGGIPPYTYALGSDQCGNYSGEGSCYNREHSFPKSWFGDVAPMNTDLFHLYPTDGYVNGKRSNFPFGETEAPTWTSQNGSKLGPCSVNAYSGTVFEPIDAYKGDFARTYFYMATRYLDEDSGWPGSPMVDGAQLKPWAKEMMLRWHLNDPVSTKERARNNAIYLIQGNRNPFIDSAVFVMLIYGGEDMDELAPDIDSISASDTDHITLWFNEPLDSLSAVNTAFYSVSSGTEVLHSRYSGRLDHFVELEVSSISDGSYVLTVNGVSDIAGNTLSFAVFPFNIAGLSSILTRQGPGFKIYPNPCRGSFQISLDRPVTVSERVFISDIYGREQQALIDIQTSAIYFETEVPPGIYFVHILYPSNEQLSIKVLIK